MGTRSRVESQILTKTIPSMIAIITLAIAETTAMIAPPIADIMEPCADQYCFSITVTTQGLGMRYNTHHVLCAEERKVCGEVYEDDALAHAP